MIPNINIPPQFEPEAVQIFRSDSSEGWYPTKTANEYTLVFPILRAENRVLLGLKKRGFATGKWNGFGGKVSAGERPEEAAIRELEVRSFPRVWS
ncbi:hypothetical protein BT69DRAFT_56112 [Atractiella rhizophila]|nr:hypothetical protein BT69DRAFT_56112 [Atractiella rhizophila]